jgi:hypothetical protein
MVVPECARVTRLARAGLEWVEDWAGVGTQTREAP